jgi:hypothetical protein
MSEAKNNKRIEKAFARLIRAEEAQPRKIMVKVLKGAMEEALHLHEMTHHNLHLIMGGDYGWALIHNGQILDFEVTSGKNDKGTAERQLFELATSMNSSGKWVGVVMAGMEAANYHINFEKGVLHHAAKQAGSQFLSLFTKVKL